MIAALMLMPLIGWGYWLMHRAVRSPQVTTPVAAPDQRATRAAAVLGLEDDPDQWSPALDRTGRAPADPAAHGLRAVTQTSHELNRQRVPDVSSTGHPDDATSRHPHTGT